MREQVIISTTVERPDGDVSTIVQRPEVIQVMAQLLALRPDQILDYQSVFGTNVKPPSHEFTIRYPRDVKVDLNHWVYHADKHTKISTWYKVRSVEDLGMVHRFLILSCTIDTVLDPRSDPATQKLPPTWQAPGGPVIDQVG